MHLPQTHRLPYLPALAFVAVVSASAMTVWGSGHYAMQSLAAHLGGTVSVADRGTAPRQMARIAPVASNAFAALTPLATPAQASEAPPALQPQQVAAVQPVAAEPARDFVRVRNGGVNVRAAARSGSRKLGVLGSNERVAMLGVDKGWVLVESGRGLRGWVYRDFIRAD